MAHVIEDERCILRRTPDPSVIIGPKVLSVMLTFTCPAACESCGTFSSPKSRERIPAQVAARCMSEASDLGFKLVVFTGGEATLRWKDLLRCIAYSKEIGLQNRLVTNGHWALNETVAAAKIDALVRAGLDEINFSTGDEHVRFVPLERVALGTKSAVERGLHTCVMVELKQPSRIDRSSILAHPHISGLQPALREKIAINESPWMPMDSDHQYQYPADSILNKTTMLRQKGCESVLSTYTIQGDGRIGACCGLGLRTINELNVGTAEDSLAEILSAAEHDWVKLGVRHLGAARMLEFAAKMDKTIEWENLYAHHCHACARIYNDTRVQQAIRDNFAELIPKIKEAIVIDNGLLASCQAANVARTPANPASELGPTVDPEGKEDE